MIINYYQILELTPSATKIDIKKAYRRLALKYHPDKNKNPDAHEKFIVINEAYLILYDDEARAKYDREYKYVYVQQESTKQKYQKQEQQQQKRNQQYTNYKSKEKQFEDEDLNNWTKNAREQGENFAKMTFENFSNLIVGMVKETGFQLGNALLLMLGALLSMGGCGNIVVGLTTKGEIGNPILGLIFLPIGIILCKLAQKNYDGHKI